MRSLEGSGYSNNIGYTYAATYCNRNSNTQSDHDTETKSISNRDTIACNSDINTDTHTNSPDRYSLSPSSNRHPHLPSPDENSQSHANSTTKRHTFPNRPTFSHSNLPADCHSDSDTLSVSGADGAAKRHADVATVSYTNTFPDSYPDPHPIPFSDSHCSTERYYPDAKPLHQSISDTHLRSGDSTRPASDSFRGLQWGWNR